MNGFAGPGLRRGGIDQIDLAYYLYFMDNAEALRSCASVDDLAAAESHEIHRVDGAHCDVHHHLPR